MKSLKLIVPLIAVLALLVIALPAAAQQPVCPSQTDLTNMWFVPTGCAATPGAKSGVSKLPAPFVVRAGTNEDPFGGLPLGTGATGFDGGRLFRVSFAQPIPPGGEPSRLSGDGTTPRKAINIGGAWDASLGSVRSDRGETPMERPTCATVAVPAGSSRWFKTDTWKNKKLQLWVDDEREGATAPSGSAVFGAAATYWYGSGGGNDQSTAFLYYSGPFTEGFTMAVYDPDNLRPNFYWDPPNAAILTFGTAGSGALLRSPPGDRGISIATISGLSGVHGWGQYNRNQPNHLLWYEAVFDGWVFVRVANAMIWNATASVCSYRAFYLPW